MGKGYYNEEEREALVARLYHAQFLQRLLGKHLDSIEKSKIEKRGTKGEDCMACIRNIVEEMSRNLEDIIQYVAIDPVLGIYTRSVFPHIRSREEESCRRNGIPLSVLFVDVDGLKMVNDMFGHDAGDRLLFEVVSLLKRTLRRADIIIRWGGDEFVVLLHATEKGAWVAKKRIQQELGELQIRLSSGDYIKPSVSIGVAEVNMEEGCNIEEAIKRADADMYAEKRKRKQAMRVPLYISP